MNGKGEDVEVKFNCCNICGGLQNHVKSRIISRKTKTLLYKTLIRLVLTYGAETWALSKQDEYRLSLFEHKILWRIYGPVIDKGEW